MGLQEYKRKRDFKKTPEPAGKVADDKGNSFVIQKHDASHLHYDFRLEMEGVLRSWAVPKGPSLDPGERRLAVHVEDHPLDYGDFEGILPEGQYGGGTVLLWDRGTWHPVGDPIQGYAKGNLKFRLDGEKLQGHWALVQMHGKQGGDRKQNWLLIKEKDETAVPGSADSIVQERPESVATGLSLEEIAADPDRVWKSNREEKIEKKEKKKGKSAPKALKSIEASSIPGARKSKMPASFEPQLATLASEPPQGDDWVHELKLDGYRIFCELRDGKVRAITRNGEDWTHRFGTVTRAVAELPAREAVLDGEVTVLLPDGTTSLQALQDALDEKHGTAALAYFAFDLLYLDGYDLRGAPLLQRKEALAALLKARADPGILRYSDHIQSSGAEVYRHACSLGLDGIVSKRSDLPYKAGRGKGWLKIKCLKRPEPKASTKPPSRKAPDQGPDQGKDAGVAGVKITHPDRVLYPDQGLTKRDVALYYERIADWILPHLENRPLTLVRCPEGQAGQCFYQKHVNEQFPASIRRVEIEEDGETAIYGAIDSVAGLVSLIQMGALELHVWGSHIDDVEKPDAMVFDLDPDVGLGWERVVEGALQVRGLLEGIGLQTYLKTTGGKGLHVCVPLVRRAGWDEVKAFSKAVVERIVSAEPSRYTSKLAKASRKGKIFIDYLRNGRGATWVAAYSTRARPGAPVSTPLFWEELESGVKGNTFTVTNLPERLEGLDGDPWAGFLKARQSITVAMKKAVGLKMETKS